MENKADAVLQHENFMREAIRLATENVANGGGPFGALIVRDGEMIATGVNRVTSENDPTAHAEVKAIRSACAALRSFSLAGCVLYASCEPCPMCLSAIYWAGIESVYYGNTHADAARIGFDDSFIYEQLRLPKGERMISLHPLLSDEARESFDAWEVKEDKQPY